MDVTIKNMKRELLDELSEWVGCDIPEEGTEDFDIWQNRTAEILAIETFADVYNYLAADQDRASEFFARYGLAVTSRVIIRPLREEVRPLLLPVLERVDGRSPLQH